jgi:hypothetical protein
MTMVSSYCTVEPTESSTEPGSVELLSSSAEPGSVELLASSTDLTS